MSEANGLRLPPNVLLRAPWCWRPMEKRLSEQAWSRGQQGLAALLATCWATVCSVGGADKDGKLCLPVDLCMWFAGDWFICIYMWI